MLLAYRFSGGVPALLATARLRLDADRVRLEVGSAARAPDSDVVAERLRLLASAMGVRRSEIVVADDAPRTPTRPVSTKKEGASSGRNARPRSRSALSSFRMSSSST